MARAEMRSIQGRMVTRCKERGSVGECDLMEDLGSLLVECRMTVRVVRADRRAVLLDEDMCNGIDLYMAGSRHCRGCWSV